MQLTTYLIIARGIWIESAPLSLPHVYGKFGIIYPPEVSELSGAQLMQAHSELVEGNPEPIDPM